MTDFKRTTPAPCKINLTLDVGRRRDDGYHDLDSIVAQLSPSDEVTLTLRPGAGAVRLIAKDKRPDALSDPPLPKGAENLAHRAARAAFDRLAPGAPTEVWINLTKRLPAEAGLGGGSSDAAAVLRLLGEAFGAPNAVLQEIAAAIGSDVTLFLGEGPVRMQGRGEIVAPLAAPLPSLHGVLIRPLAGVPTGPAYAALDALPGRIPGRATERLLEALRGNLSPGDLAPLLSNDFEAAILPAYPPVAAAHRAVREAGALRALLCGSGSAVFGLATDADQALEMTRRLARQGFPWVKKVRSLP